MARVLEISGHNIQEAARCLRGGGLVAFPTETVYGLGAVIANERSIARIFEVKKRPFFDPLIVHVSHRGQAYKLWSKVPPLAERLMDMFWPGPLTLVLPRKDTVPDIVTSGLPTVAVRMPSHPVARKLIERTGLPVAAPSANPFGRVSPTTALDVLHDLGDKVDIILDGGATSLGVESSVVMISSEELLLLRPGGISLEDLEGVGVRVQLAGKESRNLSPGTQKMHYAPRVPLYLFQGSPSQLKAASLPGAVVLSPRQMEIPGMQVAALSREGDTYEMAANLFKVLRELEKGEHTMILALPVPEKGVGRAIMDRLTRASGGRVKIAGNKAIFVDR